METVESICHDYVNTIFCSRKMGALEKTCTVHLIGKLPANGKGSFFFFIYLQQLIIIVKNVIPIRLKKAI